MRLFIAIRLPRAMQDDIAEWLKAFAREIPDPQRRLRWVKPEQLHLTLKFLGETRENQIPPIAQSLKEATAAHPGFPLSFGKVGHFGGRVIWMGCLSGVEESTSLARSIDDACERLGVAREARAFRPHLTLARSKMNPGTIQLSKIPSKIALKTFGPFTVNQVSLVQSTLSPQGSRYDVLASFPLC